jgi:hypothetical protein
MKNLLGIALVSLGLLFQSCGAKKELGRTSVKNPCFELVNNKKVISGVGEWTTSESGAAAEGSLDAAYVNLAIQMTNEVKRVQEAYLKDPRINGDSKLQQKREAFVVSKVDQIIRNSYVACREVFLLDGKSPSGQSQYIAYSRVEISRSEMADEVINAISENEELLLDFKAEIYRDKYEDFFDEK